MGRTAQLKKTSEQRCREAFDDFWKRTVGSDLELGFDLGGPGGAFLVWSNCWRYLEKQVVKEFIND